MANNGYLLPNGTCTTSIQEAGSAVCPTPPNLNYPTLKSLSIFVDPGGGGAVTCYGVCLSGSGWCNYSSIATPKFSCEISSSSTPPPSSVPTTADGIELGWKTGFVLIAVAGVLFIKKALFR